MIFSTFIHVLHNEQDYQQAVDLLDSLIDMVGEAINVINGVEQG